MIGEVRVSLEFKFEFTGLCTEIVFWCYDIPNLLWEKFYIVLTTCFPNSWEQEHCVEKSLWTFRAKG
jgi:hypothetical protein